MGKSAGKPKAKSGVWGTRKTAQVLVLLKRPTGATLKKLIKATGWQPHSVRGFLSGAVVGAACRHRDVRNLLGAGGRRSPGTGRHPQQIRSTSSNGMFDWSTVRC
jgi:hypothetical protein